MVSISHIFGFNSIFLLPPTPLVILLLLFSPFPLCQFRILRTNYTQISVLSIFFGYSNRSAVNIYASLYPDAKQQVPHTQTHTMCVELVWLTVCSETQRFLSTRPSPGEQKKGVDLFWMALYLFNLFWQTHHVIWKYIYLVFILDVCKPTTQTRAHLNSLIIDTSYLVLFHSIMTVQCSICVESRRIFSRRSSNS